MIKVALCCCENRVRPLVTFPAHFLFALMWVIVGRAVSVQNNRFILHKVNLILQSKQRWRWRRWQRHELRGKENGGGFDYDSCAPRSISRASSQKHTVIKDPCNERVHFNAARSVWLWKVEAWILRGNYIYCIFILFPIFHLLELNGQRETLFAKAHLRSWPISLKIVIKISKAGTNFNLAL